MDSESIVLVIGILFIIIGGCLTTDAYHEAERTAQRERELVEKQQDIDRQWQELLAASAELNDRISGRVPPHIELDDYDT